MDIGEVSPTGRMRIGIYMNTDRKRERDEMDKMKILTGRKVPLIWVRGSNKERGRERKKEKRENIKGKGHVERKISRAIEREREREAGYRKRGKESERVKG